MFKKIAATAALAIVAVSGAHAQTIVAGQYSGTLQFTAVNDPNGFCKGVVSVGEVQTSEGSVALGKAPIVTTAQAGAGTAASPYGVTPLVCTYAKLPTTLSGTGTTTVNGTTVCTGGPSGTVHIVTGQTIDGQTGTATVNSVATNQFKVTSTDAALEVQVNGAFTPVCFISTDALYLRTGK